MSTHAERYTQDFYAWTQAQAVLLEAQRFDALDIVNIVEEITSLGASERRALGSHLKQLMLHLLQWQYQPSGRQIGHSWRASIHHARDESAVVLEDSPSLRREVPRLLARRYPAARLLAQGRPGLPLPTFPPARPSTPAQDLAHGFLPEEATT